METPSQRDRELGKRLGRPEIWVAACVALVVSLGVTFAVPNLRTIASGLPIGGQGEFLAVPELAAAFFESDAPAVGQDEIASDYCQADALKFAERHELEKRGLVAKAELPVGESIVPIDELKETMILTPSRMNSYSLTEAPENFVGYFAQRGSFFSTLSKQVAHIEVLSTFILKDQDKARRSFTESLRNGVGPTHGIFHIDYQEAGSMIGNWKGYTNRSGNMIGCFEFAPTEINGRSVAGTGRYTQEFSENDTTIVTWGFDALYMSEGLPGGR